MKRLLATFLLFAIAGSTPAFQPRSGVWANLHESGSGYTIEIQEGVLVITIYSYQPGGVPQWYLAAGPMTNDQHNFTGTLDKYVGGQCISCVYSGSPTLIGNDGAISICLHVRNIGNVDVAWRSYDADPILQLRDRRSAHRVAGEWVFFYDVGTTTTANRFDFTTVLPPSSASGNGIAADLPRVAGCELQIDGEVEGMVVCTVANASATAPLYGYAFRFGLDETYDGLWVSGDGMTSHPMKGFKVASTAGSANKHDRTVPLASETGASVARATVGAAMREAVEAARWVLTP